MAERTFNIAGVEISTTIDSVDYSSLLEQLYLLKQDTKLTADEKTAKLQAIVRNVFL